MTKKRTLWPILGSLAAIVLWSVSAFANFHAGFALSEDFVVRAFLGAASIGADLMKVALLFALCSAWRHGRTVIAGLSLALFMVMSLWSLRAGGVFIADALGAHSARLAHARKVAESSETLMQLRQQRAGFLSEQHIKPDGQSRRAREAALQENKRVADEFATLTQQLEADITKAKDAPPTKGESFSRLLQEFLPVVPEGDKGERLVMLATAAFFALLLELGSSFGPLVLAQARLPREVPEIREQPKTASLSEAQQTLQTIQAALSAPEAAHSVLPAPQPPATPEPAPEATPEPALPQPEPPQSKSNVVDLSGRPLALGHSASLDDALVVLFEAAPGQRLLLADVVAAVNANIPRHRRLTSPRKVAEVLLPALEATGWGVEKVKIGGRIYITGLSPRHAPRARRKR